jgi:hypothetical protein
MDEGIFDPDPRFAEQWFVDEPLAQGALKAAATSLLDQLEEAQAELQDSQDPDLSDSGPLGLFPAGWRPALSVSVLRKLQVAAVVVGWKLAQPGPPIVPVCLAEEIALELIRQEAIVQLELAGAPKDSLEATHGLYEVCQDDDVLDLWMMQEPADAAVARGDSLNRQLGKADMRIEHWFDPFYGGQRGALHPFYSEGLRWRSR